MARAAAALAGSPRPEGSSPLAGWEPASIVDERAAGDAAACASAEPVEDLALRAFLDQPLILYGHHGDMTRRPRPARRAGGAWSTGSGDVEWMSIADIAASNVATRVEGDTLRVRMFTRRARVQIPAGVEHVAVDTPSHRGEDAVAIGLPDATGTVEIRLERQGAPDTATIPAPGLRPGRSRRRLMGEGRDRMVPLYRSPAARADPRGAARLLPLYGSRYGNTRRADRAAAAERAPHAPALVVAHEAAVLGVLDPRRRASSRARRSRTGTRGPETPRGACART